MANKRVGIFARVHANGVQKTVKTKWLGNARLEPVPGGIFWLTWREGTRQKYLRVNGDVNDAVAAQLRQERVLGGEDLPAIPSSSNRRTLADAIAAFLDEKAVNSLDLRSRARWKWDLDQFAKVCAKTYLDEIARRDVFKWMAYFQDKGAAARTVYNRTSSIGTFLKKSKVNVEFTFSVQKKGGDIPNYTDPAHSYYSDQQLEKFFAACDSEERVRYLFFLHSGCREREVAFAHWSDFQFAPPAKPGEEPESSVYIVQPKPELGFSTKTAETRDVPLHDDLVKALLEHRDRHPNESLVFIAGKGKPEGHFLAKLKAIALHAGLNCGQCRTKIVGFDWIGDRADRILHNVIFANIAVRPVRMI